MPRRRKGSVEMTGAAKQPAVPTAQRRRASPAALPWGTGLTRSLLDARHRCPTIPQPEDRRLPPAQGVPQARRQVPGRTGATRSRARPAGSHWSDMRARSVLFANDGRSATGVAARLDGWKILMTAVQPCSIRVLFSVADRPSPSDLRVLRRRKVHESRGQTWVPGLSGCRRASP
jgi:hypothetical protein